MADTHHSRVVRRACDLVGERKLAQYVRGVARHGSELAGGTVAPQPGAFFLMIGLLQKADPSYRPH